MDHLRRLIWSRSRVFDLETGGTEELRHPLVEGGVLDLKTGRLRRTVFTPGLRREGRWRPLTEAEFLEGLDPWAREKFAEGGPWRPFLSEPGQAPAGWLRRHLVEAVSRGDWLWAHNARFDLRFLAQNLTPAGYEKLAGSFPEELLSAGTRRAGRLHVTAGRTTYLTLQEARQDPRRAARYFVQSWQPFVQTLRQAAQRQQGLLLDTQYVMQAALAHAQEAGLMRATQDVFTGTSLEAYRVAFQRRFPGPAHTVAPDIRATAALLDDYLDLIQRIRGGRPLTPRQRRALRFHEELQPRLFPENVRLQFLRARQALLQGRPYEYYNLAGEQRYTWNFQDILDLYGQRQAIYGYPADLEALHREIRQLGLSEVERQLAEKDLRLQRLLQEAWEASEAPRGRFGGIRFSGFTAGRTINWFRNRPLLSFAAGTGAVMLGLALIPGKDDAYVAIEGLPHGWFGERRLLNTDFGSGYQDDRTSRSWLGVVWDWVKSHRYAWATVLTAAAVGAATKHYNVPGFRGLHAWADRWGARLEARSASYGPIARFFRNTAIDIVRHPVAIGAAAGTALVYEGFVSDEPVTGRDVAETAIFTGIDLADDLLYLGAAKVLGRITLGEKTLGERLGETLIGQVGRELFRSATAGALGFAVGKAAGLVVRSYRQHRRQRRPDPQAGLVQRLNRQKINHQRMNGY